MQAWRCGDWALAGLWRDGRLAYWAAAVAGIALALWIVPLSIMLGGGPLTAASDSDVAQHIVGQRYFIADSWHWPLLVARQLGVPDGTNIGLTDSIPAMAMLARLLRDLVPGALPPGGDFVILWLAVAYAAQPVAAVFALRGLGERGVLAGCVAALVAMSWHALFLRVGHPALSGHFLVLLALGLYWRMCRGQRPAAVAVPPLLALTLLIHPYLLLMAAAVVAAAPLTLLLRRDHAWRMAALGVGSGAVVVTALAVALGYTSALAPSGLFGVVSMNLLSPVYPWLSTLFRTYGGYAIDATGAQYDGSQYLGAGGLLLAAAALAQLVRERFRPLARHGGLLACAVVLTLIALSNRVYLGHHLLWKLGKAPAWLEQFQASGRLFWPVGYAIVLGSIALIARQPWRRPALALLVVAAGVQAVDMSFIRQSVHDRMRAPYAWQPETAALRDLAASHQRLTLLPEWGCGSAAGFHPLFMDMLLVGSERVMPVNTMNQSRMVRAPACGEAGYAPLADGELRVFMPTAALAAIAMPDGGRNCRQLGRAVVCTRDQAKLAGLAPFAAATIPANTGISAASDGNTAPLVWGWSLPGAGGTWSYSGGATLAGRLDRALPGPATITLWGHTVDADPAVVSHITVFFNEREIARWDIPANKDAVLTANLPADADLTQPFAIRLEFAKPTTPMVPGSNPDLRRLGIWLAGYRIGSAP